MFLLSGKVAFITGGTSGIGAAVARRFIEAGAKVAIVGRRNGEALAQEIGAIFIRADVTEENQVIEALAETERQLGKIDILVNNAGVQDTGPSIEEHSMEAFDRNVAILQKSIYLGLKYGPRYMNDGGSIINTSSIAGLLGLYGYSQYGMCKAAVLQLSQTAAMELAPRNIRVNSILPGTVRTPMVEEEPEEIALTECITPLTRIAETDDMVGVYHFLAADESAYITGQKLVVDGGLTAGISLGLLEKVMS